ncbi:MAG: HNH endonuclease, partial [Bdellovibrionales bacterium]|nr:HNH endonuclease [Bdellovibrionales bacterium]
ATVTHAKTTHMKRNHSAERRTVFQRAGGRCEYVDPRTGRVCGSTFQVQKDHIHPRALGGIDHPSNYRCLCGKHNRLMAEAALGEEWASAWRGNVS